MQPVKLTITPDGGDTIEIETLDIVTALTVTDINVGHGTAEIREGEQLVARLRKRGNEAAPYWEVG